MAGRGRDAVLKNIADRLAGSVFCAVVAPVAVPFSALAVLTAVGSGAAIAAELFPKWHPWVELGGYASNERSRGEATLWAPLVQGDRALLFSDFRGKLFRSEVLEGNFAVGGRAMLDYGNLGGWAGFDIRRSEFDNTFRQVSGGLEFLTPNFDFRVNGYLPLNRQAFVGSSSSSVTSTTSTSSTTSSSVTTGGASAPSLRGTEVILGTTGQTTTTAATTTVTTATTSTATLMSREFALHGVDGEVGVRVPLEKLFRSADAIDAPVGYNRHELRLYGGGFYFDSSNTRQVAGPRGRVEWRFNDVIAALPGSRLTLEAEFQYDDVRRSQIEAGARFRIPFGGSRKSMEAAYRRLTPQERRMSDGLERDTDIVAESVASSSSSTATSTSTETETTTTVTGTNTPVAATDAGSGEALNVFHVANAAQGAGDCSSPANACTTATALGLAGIGDLLVPVDVAGVVIANIPLNSVRQQVVGGGNTGTAAITLSDAATSVLNLSGLGGRATVQGTVTLSQTNTVRGFDINNNAGVGLQVSTNVGATNPVSDMTISGSTAGTQFTAASAGMVTFANDVTINGQAGGPAFDVLGGTANATFSGNITQAAANNAISVAGGHTGTLTFDTGTINATNGLGLQFSNADGTYNFDGTTTLNGGDAGIDIVGGSAGTFTFSANTSITNPTGTAFNVDTATNPGITYSGMISNNAGRAISIANTLAGANTITFDSAAANAIQDSGTGIVLNTVAQNVNFTADAELTGSEGVEVSLGTGTFTFTDTDIAPTSAAGEALEIAGGTTSVNFLANSSITQAQINDAVEITNHSVGTVDFDGTINATNGLGLQFSNADGTYNFDGTTTLNGGDAGIDIVGGSAGTFTFSANTSITNPTGTAFNVDTATNPGITYSGMISNNAGRAISIANTLAGANTITFDSAAANAIQDSGTGIVLNTVAQNVNFTADAELTGSEGVEVSLGTGTFTFTDTDIAPTSAAGEALEIAGGTTSVNFLANSSITQAQINDAVEITNHSVGTVDFDGAINATNGLGLQFSNADGTYNFDGTTTLNGGDAGIDIVGGSAGTFTFSANTSITNPTGTAFNVDTATNPGITYSGMISNNAGRAISIANTLAGANTITFDSAAANAIQDSGTGIVLNTVAQNVNFTADAELTGSEGVEVSLGTGTFTFTDTDIAPTSAAGEALEIAGGTTSVNFLANSSITQAQINDAVEITNHSVGTVDFDGAINATNGLGLQFSNADGTYNFDGTTTLNGGDAGIDIVGGSAGTFTFSANTSITNPTGTAFNVDGGSSAIDYNGTISNNAGRSVSVTSETGGAKTFDGTITDTGTGINLATNTGGSIGFTALADLDTGANDAITLNANNGANIDFDNVDIDTTSGNGIDATGANTNVDVSGNVAVATANNRAFEFTATSGDYDYSGVTSTQTGGVGGVGQAFNATHTGTYNLGSHTATSPGASALTITSTTLNLTYQSLTTDGTNSTDDAIQVDDVSGSLTINGGTIRSAVRGIDIQNDGGVNNSFTLTTANTQFQATGDGIFAETTTAGSTLNVNVSGITAASNFGANAIEVEWDDGGGTATIATNTIDSGSSTTGIIELDNTGSGTVTANITNTSISANSAGEAIDIRSAGTATTNVTINGGTITNVGDTAIDLSSSGAGSTLRANVLNVNIDGTGGNITDGILVEAASTGEIDATVTNNTIQNLTAGSGVVVDNQAVGANACLNATGNSNGAGGPPSSGGIGNNAFRFDDNGAGGVMDISQASAAALGAANNGGGGDVTVTSGTVTFNATCQTPP